MQRAKTDTSGEENEGAKSKNHFLKQQVAPNIIRGENWPKRCSKHSSFYLALLENIVYYVLPMIYIIFILGYAIVYILLY